jgi:hypothetical protein
VREIFQTVQNSLFQQKMTDIDDIEMPKESDEILPFFKNYCLSFLSHQKNLEDLIPKFLERFPNLIVFNSSIKTVRGFIEYSLPEPYIQQVQIYHSYKQKQISLIPIEDQEKLTMARSNRVKITRIVFKMINELKKHCYGEDLPRTPSIKSLTNSVKNMVSSPDKKQDSAKSVSSTKNMVSPDEKEPLPIESVSSTKMVLPDEEGVVPTKSVSLAKKIVLREETKNKVGHSSNSRHQNLKNSKLMGMYFKVEKYIDNLPEILMTVIPNISKSSIIFDPYCGNGVLKDILTKAGFTNVIEKDKLSFDYLRDELPNYDIMVTSTPYRNKKDYIKKAIELQKPFCLFIEEEYEEKEELVEEEYEEEE